jgi:hypothetical protein
VAAPKKVISKKVVVKKSASAPAKLVEPDLSATLAGGTMPPQIEPDSPELI